MGYGVLEDDVVYWQACQRLPVSVITERKLDPADDVNSNMRANIKNATAENVRTVTSPSATAKRPSDADPVIIESDTRICAPRRSAFVAPCVSEFAIDGFSTRGPTKDGILAARPVPSSNTRIGHISKSLRIGRRRRISAGPVIRLMRHIAVEETLKQCSGVTESR